MKNTIKKLAVALGASGFLIALPALADQPGKGWDNFNAGAGERIAVQSGAQAGVATNGTPGKGWDNFNAGAGEPIAVQSGTRVSMAMNGMPGKGWDNFNAGAGEPISAARSTAR